MIFEATEVTPVVLSAQSGCYEIFPSCLDTFLSLFTCFIGGFPAFLAFSSRAFEVEVCLIEGGAMFNRFLKDAKRSSADGILKVMHNLLIFLICICYKIL